MSLEDDSKLTSMLTIINDMAFRSCLTGVNNMDNLDHSKITTIGEKKEGGNKGEGGGLKLADWSNSIGNKSKTSNIKSIDADIDVKGVSVVSEPGGALGMTEVVRNKDDRDVRSAPTIAERKVGVQADKTITVVSKGVVEEDDEQREQFGGLKPANEIKCNANDWNTVVSDITGIGDSVVWLVKGVKGVKSGKGQREKKKRRKRRRRKGNIDDYSTVTGGIVTSSSSSVCADLGDTKVKAKDGAMEVVYEEVVEKKEVVEVGEEVEDQSDERKGMTARALCRFINKHRSMVEALEKEFAIHMRARVLCRFINKHRSMVEALEKEFDIHMRARVLCRFINKHRSMVEALEKEFAIHMRARVLCGFIDKHQLTVSAAEEKRLLAIKNERERALDEMSMRSLLESCALDAEFGEVLRREGVIGLTDLEKLKDVDFKGLGMNLGQRRRIQVGLREKFKKIAKDREEEEIKAKRMLLCGGWGKEGGKWGGCDCVNDGGVKEFSRGEKTAWGKGVLAGAKERIKENKIQHRNTGYLQNGAMCLATASVSLPTVGDFIVWRVRHLLDKPVTVIQSWWRSKATVRTKVYPGEGGAKDGRLEGSNSSISPTTITNPRMTPFPRSLLSS